MLFLCVFGVCIYRGYILNDYFTEQNSRKTFGNSFSI